MSNLIKIFKDDLYSLVFHLQETKIIDNLNLGRISIDYSSKSKQGDLSSNLLLILAKKTINKNYDLKKHIHNYILNLDYVEKVEIAKAGFINIFIKKDCLILYLKDYLTGTDGLYAKNNNIEKINIEFVSANPTGPMHVAHMRGAVLGDVLAKLLAFVGHHVTREYYVNDAGSQIVILGNSLYKRSFLGVV